MPKIIGRNSRFQILVTVMDDLWKKHRGNIDGMKCCPVPGGGGVVDEGVVLGSLTSGAAALLHLTGHCQLQSH